MDALKKMTLANTCTWLKHKNYCSLKEDYPGKKVR